MDSLKTFGLPMIFLITASMGLMASTARPPLESNTAVVDRDTSIAEGRAEDKPSSNQALEHLKELFSDKFDAQAQRFEDQNDRIRDIDAGVDRWGVILTVSLTAVGILLTIIGIVGGFAVYRGAKTEAREKAETEVIQYRIV